MPWCDTCEKVVSEKDMTESGACPACETPLVQHRKIPWHFRLLVLATVVYLGYRAYQGIAWLVHHV